MKHEIETMWMGKMQFKALVNGHTLIMDAPERVGGEDNGPIPKTICTYCAFRLHWHGCSGIASQG
jgi:hypothetical protein